MPRILFSLLINVTMPTIVGIVIVGILTFMSRKNFMLRGVEHGNFCYNLEARKYQRNKLQKKLTH